MNNLPPGYTTQELELDQPELPITSKKELKKKWKENWERQKQIAQADNYYFN